MLPGLGMDARMLQPQSSYFPNSYVMKIPKESTSSTEISSGTTAVSLAAFADGLLSNWPKQLPSWNRSEANSRSRNVFLVGVAFGGMLALEIALQATLRQPEANSHRIAGVLLIGSTRSHTNIPVSFRLQEKLIARIPVALGRAAMKRSLSKIANEEGMTVEQKQLLMEMSCDADWNQVRWGANQIAKWDRTRSSFDNLAIPVHQIHGRQDRAIKPPSISDATILLHGRHMINLSMATEVNRWIEAILRDHDLKILNTPTAQNKS
jgi:pimeloyl-ACP methyl ester carboxylesterase